MYNEVMVEKNVLFISYDGMTDPLGQSQVLPYLGGLSKSGYKITLLSCEKPERFAKNRGLIAQIVQQHNIDWRPISFTSQPPILAKYYDLFQLNRKAEELYQEKKFSLIHCRSYISIAVGLKLKKKFGVKILFDMRGFWVDERVDGGAWNLKNPFFKFAYNHYKKKEAEYIRHSDAIISLTEAGMREISTWPSYQQAPIKVIPCSTDFDLFPLVRPEDRQASRITLGLDSGAFVLSYLGSVGAWYMLDEMLAFFAQLKKQYTTAKFLFITPEPAEFILEAARKLYLLETDFIIKSANRKEVPSLVAASDVNIFFIKQSYSKIASSPTKLGEVLAMGIPVICNNKVGDVGEIVEQLEAGVALSNFTIEEYQKAIKIIPEMLKKNPSLIRGKAMEYYTLEKAIRNYVSVYDDLIG